MGNLTGTRITQYIKKILLRNYCLIRVSDVTCGRNSVLMHFVTKDTVTSAQAERNLSKIIILYISSNFD